MLEFYQHIPEHLSPTLSVGFFSVSWYSLMYLAGFFTVYLLLEYRIKKGEFIATSFALGHSREDGNLVEKIKFNSLDSRLRGNDDASRVDFLLNFLICVFIGLLIGARLGYVFFYDLKYFWENPLAVVSPFNAAGEFAGIYGMSYHGGLIGALLFGRIYCRKHKLDFIQVADFVAPAIPAGYFFGRIGNFLNGELYGRVTEKPWGMYFPEDYLGVLRHPSQLYEAFWEGIILFLIIWSFRNKLRFPGQLLGLYILSYSFFRVFCEFFREPDWQIGYIFEYFTLGQAISAIFFALGIFLFKKRKKMV